MADRLIIGFTGTREGMTDAQRETVEQLLTGFQPAEAHHGDCVGADAQFHNIAIWDTQAQMVIHPPKNGRYRAYCDTDFCGGEVRPERGYQDRNEDIVDDSDLLIATPKSITDTRGGTWNTIRYANSQSRWVILVHPDGTVGTS